MRLLIADDDAVFLRALKRRLGAITSDIVTAESGDQALEILRAGPVDVMLTDVDMPGLRGDELLGIARSEFPDTVVVIMTGHARVAAAVIALKLGAFDYIEKPFESEEVLQHTLTRATDFARLRRRNRELESARLSDQGFEGMVGQSPGMRACFSLIESVAYSDATILIEGESGTGKELAARALHRRSPRRAKPFVAVNCAALNDNLLESELFGYVKGAFTGADTMRRGLFEAAHDGTLFLDEIGHVSPAVQVRLLRVLQEGEVRRLGSNDATKVNVRVVAATHVDLAQAVKNGSFRQDLYYRLNVIGLKLPPLRERGEDLPLIAQHLLAKHAEKLSKKVTRFADAALAMLLSYAWPGNIRELENAVQRAVVLARGEEIQPDDLPPLLQEAAPGYARASTASNGNGAPLPFAEAKRQAVADFERRYLKQALEKTEGNISSAARLAGIDRSNFRRLLKEHGIGGVRAD